MEIFGEKIALAKPEFEAQWTKNIMSQPGITRAKELLPRYAVDFDRFDKNTEQTFGGNVTSYASSITQYDEEIRVGSGENRRQPKSKSIQDGFTPPREDWRQIPPTPVGIKENIVSKIETRRSRRTFF